MLIYKLNTHHTVVTSYMLEVVVLIMTKIKDCIKHN